MEDDLFTTFMPDADALLRRMAKYIDHATLERIAGFDDYTGPDQVAFISHQLAKLRDAGTVANPISGDLTDCLIRCTDFEPSVDRIQRHKDKRLLVGHWERAFAGAIMLRAFGHEATRTSPGPCHSVLIQLLRSLPWLDVNFGSETMAHLAWLIPHMGRDTIYPDHSERAFMGVGLLSLAAASDKIPDAAVVQLTQWLLDMEARTIIRNEAFADHWLRRTTFHTTEKWVALGSDLSAFKGKGPRGDAVRAIGQRMSGQVPVA